MDDLVEVVEDERLEIWEEEQVQMVKFQGEKESSQEEKNVLTALALTEEVIAGLWQLKLKENQDANSITGAAVLKWGGRIKFGLFIGRFSKIPETEWSWTEKKKEIGNGWKYLREIRKWVARAKSIN